LKEKEKKNHCFFFFFGCLRDFLFLSNTFRKEYLKENGQGGSYQGGHQSTLQKWKTMGSKRPLIDNVIGIKTKEVEHPPNRNGKGSWTRV